MAAALYLVLVLAVVSSSLASIIISNDQAAFPSIFGANPDNRVYEDYNMARGAAVRDHWDTTGPNGLKGTITSRDTATNTINGNLAPVRDGYGTKAKPELLMQSAVSQASGSSSMLYYDFSASAVPVYGFGAAIMLAYSSADIADGVVTIDINNGRLTHDWPSISTNAIEDQWIGFQTGFQIMSIRIYSSTSFNKVKLRAAPTQSVYVSLTQVHFGLTAFIINDPHFTGFQGERYEFQGESGKWFSIISDTRFQFNALFQHLGHNAESTTNMIAFGIVADDHTILIEANATTIVDGETLKKNSVKELAGGIEVTVSEDMVQVDTPQYSMAAMLKQTREGKFLNLFPVVNDMSRKPHGVLGQTLHHVHNAPVHIGDHEGKGEIEGTYTDYMVSSAFAVDSVFNKYH